MKEIRADLVHNVVNTILDGLKDSQMQVDWACEAKAAGESELTKYHLAEAQKRMSGVSEWHKVAQTLFGDHGCDPVYDAMYAYYADWARNIRVRIAEFKV